MIHGILFVQTVLCEFIHAQMTFHARAMELYTAAYQHTQAIREDEIVEVRITPIVLKWALNRNVNFIWCTVSHYSHWLS